MNLTESSEIASISSQKGRPVASERFSDAELGFLMQAFSRRFLDVFDNASQSDIARQLNTTQGTVREYIIGRRLPTAEMLITIARRKGVNLDWLLEGKGQKWNVPTQEMFNASEEHEIRGLAAARDRTFSDQVKALALAALEVNRKI